ncbi:GTP pyrophosphokinase family protein [Burkholderia sp. GbtcB21]|uniref:GTP pyrophosphokinase n=1 Tax=Burkholderia sp. GbtcB21 TaxID=2824766 RepID=UPI001C2FC87E|nr:hypothetical protein [Burkholderia sp. GbtcB21]
MADEKNSNQTVAEAPQFDFDAHKANAIEKYRDLHGTFSDLAGTAKGVLERALSVSQVSVHSIQARAKTVASFSEKAVKPSDTDPNLPKYSDPISQITDLAGVRIITFLPKVVANVREVINREFNVIEFQDKSEVLISQGKFGYQSFHFLVTFNEARIQLSEYSRFKGLVFEIQVRTLLQHAWAEMEHDIQYKNEAVIPNSIRRRFIALAGMLELADREFESLQEADQKLREDARQSVKQGQLEEIEITPDALKAYLDGKLGSDARHDKFSYDLEADHLVEMGFRTLAQVDACIRSYDDDVVSRALWGNRQGQLTRFREMLLASMGEIFAQRHPWMRDSEYWGTRIPEKLDMLRKAGIQIGAFDPLAIPSTEQTNPVQQ